MRPSYDALAMNTDHSQPNPTRVPAMVNAHSHAFQRVMAGFAEGPRSKGADFWRWRETMYAVANAITPEQLLTIASMVYLEMLEGGYGYVVEFHYLHHDQSGARYADRTAMSRPLLEAAKAVGIGITLVPILYCDSDFGGIAAKLEQRRFVLDVEGYLQLFQELAQVVASDDHASIAAGFHSLRAVQPDRIRAVSDSLRDQSVAFHIHVGEQRKEVEQSRSVLGTTPIKALDALVGLSHRWSLVHATHATQEECELIERCAAVSVICPSTEGNLGDGLPSLSPARALAVGSDSHVVVDAREEVRWLEYGQRLHNQNRLGVGASTYSAGSLWQRCVAGGKRSAGLPAADSEYNAGAILPTTDALVGDAWVVCNHGRQIDNVIARGKAQLEAGSHPMRDAIHADFRRVQHQLLLSQ